MSAVKKKLGHKICFAGNVPGSMMKVGTPAQVDEYVKKLIAPFRDRIRLNQANVAVKRLPTHDEEHTTEGVTEHYHQQYIEKNPLRRCHVVDFDEIKKILEE